MNIRRPKPALPPAPEAVTPPGPVDWRLLTLFMILLSVGLVAVLSASDHQSQKLYGDAYHFFHRQLQAMALGGVLVLFLCWVPRSFINRLHYWGIGITLVLLTLTLFFGPTINGAKRWINLHFMMLQPMEFARVALVLYLGYFFSSKQSMVKTFTRGLLPPTVVTCSICALLMLQPDLGGTIIMLALLLCMCLAGGTKGWYFAIMLALAAAGVIVLIVVEPYRWARLIAYLEPFANARGSGYQIVQSLLALGSGGIFGVGLGASVQKTRYLPEPHNDFIMSVVGEETGFVGVTLVILLFALFFWRCYKVALGQKNLRDKLTAYGLTVVIALSFTLSMAVVLGLVPPKGIAMPFISYGGSSLLANMICAGLLLHYSRTARE